MTGSQVKPGMTENSSDTTVGVFRKKDNMWYGIGGLIVGLVIGYMIGKSGEKIRQPAESESLDATRFSIKKENLDKLRVFAKENKTFTNKDVEKLLGISDPTATRYCDVLEKEGLITQDGVSGPYVKYITK